MFLNYYLFIFLRLNNKDKNDDNSEINSNFSSILNSYRYYSDIRHVASSIISALDLKPNHNSYCDNHNHTLQGSYFRSRYICSTADVLSPQFIRNAVNKIPQLNNNNVHQVKYKINQNSNNLFHHEQNQYIQTMNIHSVS